MLLFKFLTQTKLTLIIFIGYIFDFLKQQMLISILLLIVVLTLWITYSYYYKPQKQMERYRALFQKMGYKAAIIPFKFMRFGWLVETTYAQNTFKDPLYYEKTKYTEYDVVISNIINKVQISLINIELIQEFFSPESSLKYPKLEILIRCLREVLGSGIVFSQGALWKHKRKIISKAFTFQLMKENISKIIDICDNTFSQFDQKSKIDQNKSKYSVINVSLRIFNRIMLRCFFGCDSIDTVVKQKTLDEFLIKLMNQFNEVSFSPLILLLGKFPYQYGLTQKIREVREDIAIFKGISKEIIQKRTKKVLSQKRQKTTDILQALIYEQQEAKERNQDMQYTEKDIMDEISTFLFAGTDTTARFLTMMVYYIAINPQIYKRVRKDVDEIIKSDEDITIENLKKLVYIDWIQNQTTRMYGPGNGIVKRIAIVDNYLLSVPIIKGTIVSTTPASNHYSQKYFKDPHVFRPERWEKECDNNHSYVLTGFGGGPRSCIGKQFALLQSKIILIKLFKRYEEIVIPEQNITMVTHFMYEPTPFEVFFTKAK